MRKFLLTTIIVITCLLPFGCQSVRRRVAYKDDPETGTEKLVPHKRGAWEESGWKLFGVWVKHSIDPFKSRGEKNEDSIDNFLKVVGLVGAVILLLGGAAAVGNLTGQLPNNWWDEVIVFGGCILAVAAFALIWFVWIKWILTGAVVGYVGYRLVRPRLKKKDSSSE